MYIIIMLEIAKQQVCVSMTCMLHTFLKYSVHYTSNIHIIVAAPMECCNYYNNYIVHDTFKYIITKKV